MSALMTLEERWASVPRWPQYAVSDQGRVRRVSGGQGARKGQLLRPRPSAGYLRVALCVNNRRWDAGIHHLVALAFIDADPPDGHEVNHKNGIKNDNRVENLEWVTHTENQLHAWAMGLNFVVEQPRGEDNHNARLTDAQVLAIRRRVAGGETRAAMAREYGVARSSIQRIVNGVRWTHLLEGAPR